VLADFTEALFVAKTETGSLSNALLTISQTRQQVLAYLESIAKGLAFMAESAVLAKRVISQPFDSLSVVGKDIETWFKTDLLSSMKWFLLYRHDLGVLYSWDHVCSASRAVSRHSAQKKRELAKKSDGAQTVSQLLDMGQWLH
jgi:hypothetical protein